MANVVILLIILILFVLGIKETVKHFKGEGGCCGGSSIKPAKKKLKNKITNTYHFKVEGMHCQNCANTVTKAVNDLTGAAASVSLNTKMVKVKCDRAIDADLIITVIAEKGYKATKI